MQNGNVSWDRFFEDLEGQLASEWEAERAALDSEAERLRLSKVALRDRLTVLTATGEQVGVELADGSGLSGAIAAVGEDWVAMTAPGMLAIAPFTALRSVTLAHEELLRSARPAAQPRDLTGRMTLGFVLRDAARRRIPLIVHLVGGKELSGTVDRAGVDHLDLALHDPGVPRRVRDVRGYRLVPFASIAWVRWDAVRSMPS